jgi:hypothetical protein
MKPRRPFLLWLLAILAIAASFACFLQAVQAIQGWNLLIAIQYRFGPLYPIFQGTFLGATFLAAAILLLSQIAWAPTFAAITLCLSVLWSWIDRVILNLNPLPLSQQYFAVGTTVVLLGLFLGGLWTLQSYMIISDTNIQKESANSSSNGEINE